MRRFNRDFRLVVQPPQGAPVEVRPPMRVVFDANKSISGGLNKAQIQLYNLTERHRLALVKDAEEGEKVIPVRLEVGYQDRVEAIFKGTVFRGMNERQGPDLITTLECLDGGVDYLNSFTSRAVIGGRRAVDACLRDMPRTSTGKITERPVLTRPKVLVGNSARLIDEMVGPGETWYIDDEQLYIVKDDEVVSQFIPLVSARTGLISTPERENRLVTFETLMNPAVRIGRRAQLQSATAPHLDGVYRVETVNYAGDNYGDDWSMTCTGRLVSDVVVL